MHLTGGLRRANMYGRCEVRCYEDEIATLASMLRL